MSERLRRARPTVLAAALVAVVAALALPASGLGVEGKSNQACELSVFSWWTGGGEAAGLTKLIAIWNKAHPDCKFKNETVAGGAGTNAKAVLAQRLAAGNPPDSFQGHAGAELRDYIKAGQVLPIDFIYKQAGFGKSMPASLINQIRYNGKIYSVPVNIHRANVLWYNPKTLRANGIAVAEDVGTVDDRVAEGGGRGSHPARDGRAVDGEAPARDGHDRRSRAEGLGGAVEAELAGQVVHQGGDERAQPLQHAARLHELRRRVADLAGRREARGRRQGRLQRDGRLAGRLLQRHQEGRKPRPKPGTGYGWAPVPGTDNVYDWLSDSFTLPKGAPHQAAAVQWLTFLGSRVAQDTFNPVKGSIPARKDANAKLYGPYLKSALKDWKSDALAGSLTHGVVASNAWNADIDTALGLFLQTKNVGRFQTALVAAAKKNS